MPTSYHHQPRNERFARFRGCDLSLVATTSLDPENEQRVLVFGVAISSGCHHQLLPPENEHKLSFSGFIRILFVNYRYVI